MKRISPSTFKPSLSASSSCSAPFSRLFPVLHSGFFFLSGKSKNVGAIPSEMKKSGKGWLSGQRREHEEEHEDDEGEEEKEEEEAKREENIFELRAQKRRYLFVCNNLVDG